MYTGCATKVQGFTYIYIYIFISNKPARRLSVSPIIFNWKIFTGHPV